MSENKNITKALLKAQAGIGNASKNKKNPHFKSDYADLNSVLEAIKQPLLDEGIAVMQPFSYDDGVAVLNTVLLHESGESIESMLPILCNDQNPQKVGSFITYMRRYALASLLGIGADDDDGNAAAQPPNPFKTAKAQKEAFNDMKAGIEECGTTAELKGFWVDNKTTISNLSLRDPQIKAEIEKIKDSQKEIIRQSEEMSIPLSSINQPTLEGATHA